MKSKYSREQKLNFIKGFCDLFYNGAEGVLDLIKGRFLNEEPEENFDNETKGFFIKAAQELFNDKTNIDRITIKEIEVLFKTNETLLELQKQFFAEEFRIIFKHEYSSKGLSEAFFRLFEGISAVKDIKDFVLKRFLNKNFEKNLNEDEQKICLSCAESVISGEKKSIYIEKEDIKKFKKLFIEDLDLIELQKSLQLDVVGEINDDDSSSESDYN